MNRRVAYLGLSLTLLLRFCIVEAALNNYRHFSTIVSDQDTLCVSHYLYNGRIWRDIYSHKAKGDQYLFSKEFLPGSVTFNERLFKNLKLRYDILNDEVLLLTELDNVLQLNKEMVSGFEIEYENTTHYFTISTGDSTSGLIGYAEVLYNGKTALYLKHIKKIFPLSHGSNYDGFEESDMLYLFKDGKAHRVTSRKDLISLMGDKNKQIASYVRTNKLKISKKYPESFVRVLKYYDSLSR